MRARRTSHLSLAALAVVLATLALPSVSPAASDTLVKINEACSKVGVDLGAWIDARAPISSDYAGTWALDIAVGGEAPESGYAAASDLVDSKILVEDISRGGSVVFRTVTGNDDASGKQVSLWADARDGSCRQLEGSFSLDENGSSASRKMADQAGSLSIGYTRVTTVGAPTGAKDTGGSCIAGQVYQPPPNHTVKWCKNGTCLSNNKCP